MNGQRVRNLMLQFDANIESMRREMLRAADVVDQQSGRIEDRANRAGAALDDIGGAASGTADQMKFLEGAAKGFLAAFSVERLLAGASSIAMVNSQFQTLEARMRVATGSVGTARAELDRLEQFAADTPFTLDEVVNGWLKLKNLGLDPNIEALRDYGNIASASGKSVMDFIEAVADASVNEFERLKEFGIKARQEGDNVTFTFRGIETTVQKSSGAIVGYLRSIATEIGDGMGAQMETMEGRVSNLDDAFDRLQRTIGKLGFNDFFIDQVEKMTASLDYIGRQMEGLQRIRQNQGFAAMMTATADEAVEAGTPEGMLNRLTRQANEATSRRVAAEQARERGQLGAGNIVTVNARRAEEAEARRRLSEYQRGEYLESVVGRFPLNERGRFGAVPAPAASSGGSSAKRAAAAKATPAAPSWLSQARAGDFDTPAMAFDASRAFTAELPMAQTNLEAMYATLLDMQALPPIQPIDAEAIEIIDTLGASMARTMGLAIANGQSFWGSMQAGLRAFVAEMAIGGLTDLFGLAFGGSPTSSLGKLLFGGRRSSGGPVEPGVPYLVGENQPEIFIPTSRGRIAPNPGMGAGTGQPQQVEVTVRAAEEFDVRVQQVSASTGAAAGAGVIARALRPVAPGSIAG